MISKMNQAAEMYLTMSRLDEILPDLSDSREEDYKKFVEKIIKVNREIFVLFVLLDKQTCGYDVIKEIFLKCNVFLSQGTVYPILYSLEEEGILHAEFSRGDLRTKRYSLTPEGREIAQSKIKEFVKAMNYVSALIEREYDVPGNH